VLRVKAAVCRAFGEPLVIEELTIEGPQAGELLVDVKACAICHSDITYMDGGWGGDLPALYGHEAAGIVRAVGAETPGIAVGDHVVVTLIRSCGQCYYCSRGDRVLCEATLPLSTRTPIHDADGKPVAQMMNVGSFAEQVLVHYSQVAVIPTDVGFDVASLLGCGVITGVGAAINQVHHLMRTSQHFGDIRIDLRREFAEARQIQAHPEISTVLARQTHQRGTRHAEMPPKVISTVHKSKGLETLNAILLPCDANNFANNEKNRCLLDVALSRAPESLTLVVPQVNTSPLLFV
jgi:hypothetical protein